MRPEIGLYIYLGGGWEQILEWVEAGTAKYLLFFGCSLWRKEIAEIGCLFVKNLVFCTIVFWERMERGMIAGCRDLMF